MNLEGAVRRGGAVGGGLALLIGCASVGEPTEDAARPTQKRDPGPPSVKIEWVDLDVLTALRTWAGISDTSIQGVEPGGSARLWVRYPFVPFDAASRLRAGFEATGFTFECGTSTCTVDASSCAAGGQVPVWVPAVYQIAQMQDEAVFIAVCGRGKELDLTGVTADWDHLDEMLAGSGADVRRLQDGTWTIRVE